MSDTSQSESFSVDERDPDPFTTDPEMAGLNPDQLDAVVHRGGPLLVVAGAGSGKTRVLTHRIAHLIHEGVHPSRILAITFTNKAADEMRERVAELVGPVAKTMWVSTFHSACVRILRANADRLGYPRQFSIYDQADAVRLTGYVIRDLGLDAKRFTPRGVHARDQPVEERAGRPRRRRRPRPPNIFDRKHADVYREYQARLHKAGRDGLRRPAHQHRAPVPRAPRRARALPRALRAHPRRRVPGHQPGPERDRPAPRRRPPATSASSATRTSRCTASGAPTSGTSCSSRMRSRTSPRSCSTRTTAARRRSSTPPTR